MPPRSSPPAAFFVRAAPPASAAGPSPRGRGWSSRAPPSATAGRAKGPTPPRSGPPGSGRRTPSPRGSRKSLEPVPQPDGTPEAGAWAADYETALVTAAATGRPVVVHLYAEWCGPCAEMEEHVLDAAPVLAELGGEGVVGVRVDVDDREDLGEKYAVTALPMDVFLTPEGEVLTTAVGPADAAGYAGRLGRVAAHVAPVPAEGEVACDTCETDDPRELLAGLAKDRAADDPAVDGIGLKGYSPVSLIDGKVWVKGSAAFSWYADGVTYHLADAEELSKFRADPAKYAPQLSGFDPHLLSTTGRAVPGRPQFGAFYEDRLYLHATDANRRAFIADPAGHKLPARVFAPVTEVAAKAPAAGEMVGS